MHNNIRVSCDKLSRVLANLMNRYNDEFIPHLISQATDEKTRYERKSHCKLELGDIVLIKEENTKPTNFPMGRIVKVSVNDLGETTGAVVLKGATGERVKRHASVLIPLLQHIGALKANVGAEQDRPQIERSRGDTRRVAAVNSELRSRAMLGN